MRHSPSLRTCLSLIGLLLLCVAALPVMGSTTLPSDEECIDLGFTRADVSCSACDILAKHLPEGDATTKIVLADCRNCCTAVAEAPPASPSDSSEIITHVRLEYNHRALQWHPELNRFMSAASKEFDAKQFSLQQVSMYHPPRMALLNAAGEEVDSASIRTWSFDQMMDLCRAKLLR